MRSRQLHSALTGYLEAAASHLRAEVASGAEVPFDVGSHVGRGGGRATPLYCYRALTGAFIAEREAALKRLQGHAEAAKLLEGFDGLERYLTATGTDVARTKGRSRARAAMRTLLEDVFHEQTDFHLRPERLRAALGRLERSAVAGPSQLTLVATLHGLAISSAEIRLAKGLAIAHPDAIEGVPPAAATSVDRNGDSHLLVVLTVEQDDAGTAILEGREALRDLLRALRLFGAARLALGVLGWAQLGSGEWRPLAIGGGGRPSGMALVTVEQEDELRAFCSLVSRRAPHGDTLAWALRRFELGCERDSPHEALSDHLLALRALLEPEGPASGLLAGRVAALCATPEDRADLTERVAQTVALERTIIAGASVKQADVRARGEELAGHLRALLSDVVCGHLDADLAALADELLLSPEESPAGQHADGIEAGGAGPGGVEAAGLADADESPESPADEPPSAQASEPPELAHAGESEVGEAGAGESADADADELAQTTDARDGAGKAVEAS